MCMCLSVCMRYVYHVGAGALGHQKRVLGSLELKFVSHSELLGTELRSSARAGNAYNC